MEATIYIATHKPYIMPKDDMYIPLQVGATGKETIEDYVRDDTGENISEKNANYCELTGLYWIWKHANAEYVGLVHYRRHFSNGRLGVSKMDKVMEKEQWNQLLQEVDVVLPKPRNYFIETNYSQYVHAHHQEDLDKTREILSEMYPEYLAVYDEVMKRTWGHRFNMFVMTKSVLQDYCTWLFDILFTLEERLDISGYSKNDARVFGFVSERLLDVWLLHNDISYKEIPYVFMEQQNWLKKGFSFLIRKFRHTK